MAINTERFRKITLDRIEFIDSYHMLTASLGELVGDLVAGGHTFNILKDSDIYATEEQKNFSNAVKVSTLTNT